jgi:hypothetical protein
MTAAMATTSATAGARMDPPAAPASANGAERAVFAALARFLDAGWSVWFQTPLPGRENPGGRRTPLRADFVALGPAGLYVIEVKGWRAVSVVAADDSAVHFRNGVRAQHPLVQAYRYAAALTALLRDQPGVLRGGLPVRYAAALPYVHAAALPPAWPPALQGARLLCAEALGPALPERLAALPPAGGAVTGAQRAAVARLLSRARPPVTSRQPTLFDG